MFAAAFFTSSSLTLPHPHRIVKHFFQIFFKLESGEGGIWTLAPLLTTYSLSRGAPSASLGTSPNCPTQSLHFLPEAFYIISRCFCFVKNFFNFFKSCFLNKRREWDSNPRALADKRFSRPPRYDHFDISPYVIYCCLFTPLVQRKMYSIIIYCICQQ